MSSKEIPLAVDSLPSVAAADAGLHAAAVQSALDFAVETGARQLLVVTPEGVVAAALAGARPDDTFDVFAVQKSIFAILFGMACARGLADVNERLSDLLGAGWSRLDAAAESRVCVRHVLTMTTGMNDQLEPLGTLGETWRYNNVAYGLLKAGLCERVGMNLDALTSAWLGRRLGWRDTHWREREARLPDGRPMTGLFSSAHDLARFGLAMLATAQGSTVDPLIEADYWAACRTPGSQANPAWGYLWWFNGRARYMLPFSDREFQGAIVPGAPDDLIAARGANDQRVIILPGRSLVVVRLGEPVPRAAGNFDTAFMARLLENAENR